MKLTLATALFLCALPALAQQRAEVLVLGTYHMANPGHDIYNMKADDVLAPKRQEEMAQVIAALKKFNPTKIAVEADPDSDRVTKAYADYLAGKHELTQNEIEQIGFRLAKDLGQTKIYRVDADGDFPYTRLANYAKGSGRSKELDAIMAGFGEMVKEQDAELRSHTILETLLWINADDKVTRSDQLYALMGTVGEIGDWAGADLEAAWYRRNIRIYSNIVRLIESPNERVLVIFGAGHLGWLRHDIAANPNLRLRKLAEFAP